MAGRTYLARLRAGSLHRYGNAPPARSQPRNSWLARHSRSGPRVPKAVCGGIRAITPSQVKLNWHTVRAEPRYTASHTVAGKAWRWRWRWRWLRMTRGTAFYPHRARTPLRNRSPPSGTAPPGAAGGSGACHRGDVTRVTLYWTYQNLMFQNFNSSKRNQTIRDRLG